MRDSDTIFALLSLVEKTKFLCSCRGRRKRLHACNQVGRVRTPLEQIEDDKSYM